MKKNLLERERHELLSQVLGMPLSQVRQVVYALKTADRIPLSRAGASTWRPKTLARVILGLCADPAVRAAETEQALGAASRRVGGGAQTAEEVIADLLAAAVCWPGEVIDWHRPGDVFVCPSGPGLSVTFFGIDGNELQHVYGTAACDPEVATKYVRIPLGALRRLALEILEEQP